MLVSAVHTEAQALLNDASGDLYSATILLPFTKKALYELQSRYLELGIAPLTKEISAAITVNTGTAFTTVTLPTDLLEPEFCEEKLSTDTLWTPMEHLQTEPEEFVSSPRLQYWWWREETLGVRPATMNRQIRIHYTKGFNADIDAMTASSAIASIRHKTYLAARVASLAAGVIGQNESLSLKLENDAEMALVILLNTEVRQSQMFPVRRRPYRRSPGYRRG